MARLISVGNHNFTASSWGVCDTTAVVDTETAALNISTSTSTHITPTFTPGAITVDGIALKIRSRVASPTGTFTVVLRNSTAGSDVISVVVNVSDLKINGWHFFKFTNTLLLAATLYAVRVTCSVASEVTLQNVSSQNYAKLLRTTTTAAPAAGDQLLVINSYTAAGASTSSTVTMNNTAATAFGGYAATYIEGMAVSGGGTLTWGTSASTNYLLTMKGRISIYDGSTWNRGVSGGRMPSTSTAKLSYSVTTNVDSGRSVFPGGILNEYGNTISSKQTLMTADKAAGATTLVVGSTAGWAVGDQLAIASTSQTYTEAELRTILTVDSATQVTLTAALTYAHSGTSPTQAEVIHLTRNVSTYGTSTSLQGYERYQTTSVVNVDSCEFYNMGSGATNTAGVEFQTTTGSCLFTNCSVHDSASGGLFTINGAAASGITISNCNIYNIGCTSLTGTATTGTWTVDTCVFINVSYVGLSDVGGTFTNNVCCSSSSYGLFLGESGATTGTISGLTAHSNASTGLYISSVIPIGSLSFTSLWRNLNYGIQIVGSTCTGLTITGGTIFGNALYGIYFPTANTISTANSNMIFNSIAMSGDSTFAQANGLYFNGTSRAYGIILNSCTFGVASGIYVAHSTQDIFVGSTDFLGSIILRNCNLASSTEVTVTSYLLPEPYASIVSQKHDQTAGLHKRWGKYGIVSSDLTTFRTAAPSILMTPNNASNKLNATMYPQDINVLIDSGQAATFTCYVYKSASYNGNQPRLIVKGNAAIGITSDTVLATAVGGTGSWLTLTGTTSAVTGAGVLAFTVDCDGTAGTVNVSDFSATVA